MRRLLVAILLLNVAVPAADAGTKVIGSDLEADAGAKRSAPVDSVYWNTKLASGRVKSPVKGEVGEVIIKGRINPTGPQPPDVVMHVQVLHPVGGGKVKVTVTSGNLTLPFGGDKNRLSAYDLQAMPARICVKKGDYVALSTSGGFGTGYEHGAEFQMFGNVAGSAVKSVTGAGRDMDGDVVKGHARQGKELLLQARIKTGKDARPTCQ